MMRTVRWAFILTLVCALNPSFAEAAGALVECARTGQVTHEAHRDDAGDQGTEHSCPPSHHHCGCCARAPMETAPVAIVQVVTVPSQRAPAEACRWGDVSVPPLFRPPIA